MYRPLINVSPEVSLSLASRTTTLMMLLCCENDLKTTESQDRKPPEPIVGIDDRQKFEHFSSAEIPYMPPSIADVRYQKQTPFHNLQDPFWSPISKPQEYNFEIGCNYHCSQEHYKYLLNRITAHSGSGPGYFFNTVRNLLLLFNAKNPDNFQCKHLLKIDAPKELVLDRLVGFYSEYSKRCIKYSNGMSCVNAMIPLAIKYITGIFKNEEKSTYRRRDLHDDLYDFFNQLITQSYLKVFIADDELQKSFIDLVKDMPVTDLAKAIEHFDLDIVKEHLKPGMAKHIAKTLTHDACGVISINVGFAYFKLDIEDAQAIIDMISNNKLKVFHFPCHNALEYSQQYETLFSILAKPHNLYELGINIDFFNEDDSAKKLLTPLFKTLDSDTCKNIRNLFLMGWLNVLEDDDSLRSETLKRFFDIIKRGKFCNIVLLPFSFKEFTLKVNTYNDLLDFLKTPISSNVLVYKSSHLQKEQDLFDVQIGFNHAVECKFRKSDSFEFENTSFKIVDDVFYSTSPDDLTIFVNKCDEKIKKLQLKCQLQFEVKNYLIAEQSYEYNYELHLLIMKFLEILEANYCEADKPNILQLFKLYNNITEIDEVLYTLRRLYGNDKLMPFFRENKFTVELLEKLGINFIAMLSTENVEKFQYLISNYLNNNVEILTSFSDKSLETIIASLDQLELLITKFNYTQQNLEQLFLMLANIKNDSFEEDFSQFLRYIHKDETVVVKFLSFLKNSLSINMSIDKTYSLTVYSIFIDKTCNDIAEFFINNFTAEEIKKMDWEVFMLLPAGHDKVQYVNWLTNAKAIKFDCKFSNNFFCDSEYERVKIVIGGLQRTKYLLDYGFTEEFFANVSLDKLKACFKHLTISNSNNELDYSFSFLDKSIKEYTVDMDKATKLALKTQMSASHAFLRDFLNTISPEFADECSSQQVIEVLKMPTFVMLDTLFDRAKDEGKKLIINIFMRNSECAINVLDNFRKIYTFLKFANCENTILQGIAKKHLLIFMKYLEYPGAADEFIKDIKMHDISSQDQFSPCFSSDEHHARELKFIGDFTKKIAESLKPTLIHELIENVNKLNTKIRMLYLRESSFFTDNSIRTAHRYCSFFDLISSEILDKMRTILSCFEVSTCGSDTNFTFNCSQDNIKKLQTSINALRECKDILHSKEFLELLDSMKENIHCLAIGDELIRTAQKSAEVVAP